MRNGLRRTSHLPTSAENPLGRQRERTVHVTIPTLPRHRQINIGGRYICDTQLDRRVAAGPLNPRPRPFPPKDNERESRVDKLSLNRACTSEEIRRVCPVDGFFQCEKTAWNG